MQQKTAKNKTLQFPKAAAAKEGKVEGKENNILKKKNTARKKHPPPLTQKELHSQIIFKGHETLRRGGIE